ncbi:hypothetical protein K5X82_14115 [Halosquirtibacter xylanolyticus]|uniref:hypothetical protein n=1 Tax=Halosquirtibacter xylanolyticus TaxID=3374599 RepID=UPI00374A6EEE|nr:hypothetical protein K5X82_14115 [Prolixibacteraceae bacterium]
MKNIIITIDTECDKSVDWSNSEPISFFGIHVGVKTRLQPLFEKYNIKPVYFISYEVMCNRESVDYFKDLHQRNKCELGTHLHFEYINAKFENIQGKHCDGIQSELSLDDERIYLDILTDKFKECFEFSPVSFRAGRFGISKNTASLLSDLGYKIDSSITPGIHWKYDSNNDYLDFTGCSRDLYFVDEEKGLKFEGNSKLLEVPITTIPKKSFKNLLKRLIGRGLDIDWLRPMIISTEDAYNLINNDLKNTLPLVVMFHNMEVVPKLSPYVTSESESLSYLSFLEKLFIKCKKHNIKSVTFNEFYDEFKK